MASSLIWAQVIAQYPPQFQCPQLQYGRQCQICRRLATFPHRQSLQRKLLALGVKPASPQRSAYRQTLAGAPPSTTSQEVHGHLGVAFQLLASCGGLLHTSTGLHLRKGPSFEELINLQSCASLIVRTHVTKHWRAHGKQTMFLCTLSCTGGTQHRPLIVGRPSFHLTQEAMTHLSNGAFAHTLYMADLLPRSDLLRVGVDNVCNLLKGYPLKSVICRV